MVVITKTKRLYGEFIMTIYQIYNMEIKILTLTHGNLQSNAYEHNF